ncbi:MATE efflux family protein 1-like protein [Carex littledalei]|uniref:Protein DETOXIFICATION n=1 Tax=Carex littledalei TaxID=544730 RepID=A0A833VEG0_9POAL|nr:MATE efflux family protein 1-like protein [Carex littledalei]
MVTINGSEHDTAVKVVATEATVPEKVATDATGGVATETTKQEMVVMEMAIVDTTKGDDDSSTPSLGLPWKTGLHLFVLNLSRVFKLDDIGSEILRVAIPASLALAADPIASLVDTAFMGQIGKSEVAAVGVAVAIFNQIAKVFIYPLVSVTTSFVAEEEALINCDTEEQNVGDLEISESTRDAEPTQMPPLIDSENKIFGNVLRTNYESLPKCAGKRKFIPSVTSALIVGAVLGLIQAFFLILTAKYSILLMTGGKPSQQMRRLAFRYLTIRALGSPANLLQLAMIGVFRGFKDTKTPLYAIVIGDVMNIILEAIMVFVFHMSVTGAAIAHVFGQYLIALILFFALVRRVDIIPPSIKSLKFRRFIGCGFMLLGRVIAVTSCVTLASSLAARQGDTIMAAFQISNQIWMSTSLLADGLAVAGQAILAAAFAKSDHYKVVVSTARVLQMSIVMGLCLSVFLGILLSFGASIFSKDADVIEVVHQSILFVAGLQTVNSVAFVFDGINFGASDYTFSAYSMVGVAAISVPCIIVLSMHDGYIGIWIGLALYMILRTLASTWRMGAAAGPWSFLRKSQ